MVGGAERWEEGGLEVSIVVQCRSGSSGRTCTYTYSWHDGLCFVLGVQARYIRYM